MFTIHFLHYTQVSMSPINAISDSVVKMRMTFSLWYTVSCYICTCVYLPIYDDQLENLSRMTWCDGLVKFYRVISKKSTGRECNGIFDINCLFRCINVSVDD